MSGYRWDRQVPRGRKLLAWIESCLLPSRFPLQVEWKARARAAFLLALQRTGFMLASGPARARHAYVHGKPQEEASTAFSLRTYLSFLSLPSMKALPHPWPSRTRWGGCSS